IEIVKAGIDEMDLLMKWRLTVLRDVFELPENADMTGLERENRIYYEREIPAGGHIAVLAKAGGTVVGCGGVCLYSEMPSPDNPDGQCAYIMNIYTVPEWRGRGVGTEIVAALLRETGSRGITKVYLETSIQGQPLYEKFGFEEMHHYLMLK
ncbi:MAG: GNAT family N-acetyltransferase, partial [Anaerovoracaceae bacterium]|nr:GNAT family N-acetyltransferase [Anaerovoracaceae bacterium]